MVKKKRQLDGAGDGAYGSSTDSCEDISLQSPSSVNDGCQHVKKSVDTVKLRKILKSTGLATDCSQCESKDIMGDDYNPIFEYNTTLWLCLKCGSQLCGRTWNQHALKHYKTPHSDSHALTMNTRSYEIYCYQCDSEINAQMRKNLLECVEIVKKISQQPATLPTSLMSTLPPTSAVSNIEGKILATLEVIRPLIPKKNGNAKNAVLSHSSPPPPPPIPFNFGRINDDSAVGCLKSNNSSFFMPTNSLFSTTASTSANAKVDSLDYLKLHRVRGLTNLGNTCFFNAVVQCLAQTPYLLEVLKEMAEPGEEFTLPGGTFKLKDDTDIELPAIKGTLQSWGSLTAALAQTLEELQTGGGVFTPSKLFDKLCNRCPQFRGGDQHDSHELLRHLLESVRSEDLKRYQRVILQNLGYNCQDISSVSEDMRQKCKIYGNQAADRILRPDQVFRGFLVSTLTCQDCFNVSSRHEYFLDISLPVSVEKPQPPQRRKASPDNEQAFNFFLNPSTTSGPTKSQLKHEKERERRGKRAAKHRPNKLAPAKQMLEGLSGTVGGSSDDVPMLMGCATQKETENVSPDSSTSEHSDADVEDNLMDDNVVGKIKRPLTEKALAIFDTNGNDQPISPSNPEKRGDSPENMDKDSPDEDENDSGIANSPANVEGNFPTSSQTNGDMITSDGNSSATLTNSRMLSVGISERGANLVREFSHDDVRMREPATETPTKHINGEIKAQVVLTSQLNQLELDEQKTARKRAKRVRTQSHSDWSTTVAPRYQCEDGECSVQSCLNNFTAVELMTGNNKVGCDNCTKRINGDDPKAKTVNTNATKQFLISSPPAVLILHLKRFQLGQRCIFRKLTRAVSFPMILDIAPFCGSKVKNLPNIDRKQKKLYYALYGIVEHSGGMYGGHYTSYVKVRAKLEPQDKRWKFMPQGSKTELDQDDEQRKKLDELLAKEKARDLRMKTADDSDDFSTGSTTESSSESEEIRANEAGAVGGDETCHAQVPLGKWYYVSDSRVQEVSEETVLKAQAYLLFYERIY